MQSEDIATLHQYPSTRKNSADTTTTTGSDSKKVPTKLQGVCTQRAQESYKCLEENPGNRMACKSFFDEYRKCRQIEHDAIIAERRRNS
eukprot:scaffold453_cov187-Ochromonas_danica.AAC.3